MQDIEEEEKSIVKLDEPGLETVDMDEFNNSCVFDECAMTHSTVFRKSGCVVAGFMTKCNETKPSTSRRRANNHRRNRRKQTKQKTEVFAIKIEPNPMEQLDGDSGIQI